MIAQSQNGQAMTSRGFDEVKKVVEDLANVLVEQQKTETEKKDHCNKEIGEKEAEKAEVEDKIKALEATIESKESQVSTLTSEVDQINKDIAESKKMMEDAEAIR